MKKQILKAFLILAVAGSASTAFATSITGTVTIGGPANTFTPSAKVALSVTSGATSYCAGSAHLNGTKEFATCGGTGITGTTDVSKIYSKDYTTTSGSTVATPTTQDSATTLAGSGWN
jgi:hypothetical protein